MAKREDELRNRAIGLLDTTRRGVEAYGEFLEPQRMQEIEADLKTITMLLREANEEELLMIIAALETAAHESDHTMNRASMPVEPFQTIIGWKALPPKVAHQAFVELWGTRYERPLSDHRVLMDLILEFSKAHPPMQSMVMVWWAKPQEDIFKQEHDAHQLEEFIHFGFALEKQDELKAGIRLLFDVQDPLLLAQNRWRVYLRLGILDALKIFTPYPHEADLFPAAAGMLTLSDPLVRIHHHFGPIFDALRAIERDDLVRSATQLLHKSVPDSDWPQVAETLALNPQD